MSVLYTPAKADGPLADDYVSHNNALVDMHSPTILLPKPSLSDNSLSVIHIVPFYC